jgi:hypothetical protein
MGKLQTRLKAQSLADGESQLEELVALDYRVEQFAFYHFRINERLDVWPSTKKYYDHKTLKKGFYDDLVEFVTDYLK